MTPILILVVLLVPTVLVLLSLLLVWNRGKKEGRRSIIMESRTEVIPNLPNLISSKHGDPFNGDKHIEAVKRISVLSDIDGQIEDLPEQFGKPSEEAQV